MMDYLLTASIVTYNNDSNILKKTIQSFLNTNLCVHLYIIDHSSNKELNLLCQDERITYSNTGKNMGYGAGHNLILKERDLLGKYHIVLNPDIIIKKGTLEYLTHYLDDNIEVGGVIPGILNADETVQLLPKLFPHPLNLVVRFVPFLKRITKKMDNRYMMADMDYSKAFDVGIISGCFMMMRSAVFENDVFDERFFMYFEDFDLSRRVGRNWQLRMIPEVSVYHNYERGAYKSFLLFRIFLFSMFKYFNKYGWFFDNARVKINRELTVRNR